MTIYCLGEVRSPGALVFSSGERITVLAAIARAGGLGDRASTNILIKRRRRGQRRREQFEVNYQAHRLGQGTTTSSCATATCWW